MSITNRTNLIEIVKAFPEYGKYKGYKPVTDGHINDTYLTSTNNFILQRINTNVFKKPVEVMDNIERVTSFLREKIIKNGGDPERETMTVIKTADGQNVYKYDDGSTAKKRLAGNRRQALLYPEGRNKKNRLAQNHLGQILPRQGRGNV